MYQLFLVQRRCDRVLGSVINGDSNIFLNEHRPILRTVPGFDVVTHRPQGGCLLSSDHGSDLRDDVSETHKLACAGTLDGGYLFKGRDPERSWEITVTSSNLVSVPSSWITMITLQDGALDLNRSQEAKPAIRPFFSTAHRSAQRTRWADASSQAP